MPVNYERYEYNQKEIRYHSPTHLSVVLRKLQVLVLSICKSSMNIYTIMYRVLYNENGEKRRIEMMMRYGDDNASR